MTAMRKTISVVLMALCIPCACDAVDLPQTIRTKDDFTISLPADWVAIPKDALDDFTRALAKLSPKAERQIDDYGFQLPKKKHWLEFPYIIIQVKRIGRVPEAQLKSIKRVVQDTKKVMEKEQDSYSAVISNAQVGETVYEPATHILWTKLSAEVKTTGTVKALLASVLTEKGVIGIYGYAPAADFDKYAPVFEAVARSAVVADNLKYRPHFTDSLPLSETINWGLVLRAALIGAIAGCLPVAIILIPRLRRKKKADAGKKNGSGASS